MFSLVSESVEGGLTENREEDSGIYRKKCSRLTEGKGGRSDFSIAHVLGK